ncbi:MAG: hypothetical protein H0X39_03965 [Actinobacteria bacterium]|nr:hypothetical protein [Actinomycetota bacterium]
MPTPEDFDAEEAGWDRSAPPLIAVRRALKALDNEIARKKRYSQHRKHMFQELRDRALLAVLVVFGPRAEAVWWLDVDHYIRDHTFPDGTKGPALQIPKTKREKHEHKKALPPEVAQWIEEYITYIDAKPGEPLWRPGRKSLRDKRLDQQNFHDMLLRRLSPHCDQKNYSPHTLRHFASGVATLVGMEWIRERSDQFLLGSRGIPASPQTFSDVLLGQALHTIADRYRDMDTKQNREIWTKVTVEGVWEWVWGDKGARKGPDLKLVASAEQKVIGARTELDGLEASLNALEQQAQRPKALTEHEGIQLLLQIMTTTRALMKATSTHERALRELELAREARVPIDDSISEAPELPDTEFEILRYEDEDERPLLRMRLLPEEYRWCIGADILPRSTLRHWMAGRLPCDLGDRRRMFELDAIWTDPDHPRKRYILIDKLDPSRYHVDAWERIMELCRRPEPKMPSRHTSRREEGHGS